MSGWEDNSCLCLIVLDYFGPSPQLGPMTPIKTLAQRHHAQAKLFAQGHPPAAPLDPSMRELVAHYKSLLKGNFPSSFVLPPEVQVSRANYRSPLKTALPKACQRAGLLYEQRIGKGLLAWGGFHGLEYFGQFALRDSDGALSVPDHLLLAEDYGFIFETKLTAGPGALEQLARYAKLCSNFFKRPFFLVLVARTLSKRTAQLQILRNIDQLLTQTSEGPYVLHIWQPLVWLTTLPSSVEPDVAELLPEPDFDFDPPTGRKPADYRVDERQRFRPTRKRTYTRWDKAIAGKVGKKPG